MLALISENEATIAWNLEYVGSENETLLVSLQAFNTMQNGRAMIGPGQ